MNEQRPRSRYGELIVLVPIAFGFLLWFPGIWEGSIVNSDDGSYASLMRHIAEGRSDVFSAMGWRMPVFYLMGAASTVVFGVNELGLRLPSLLCALTCVGLVYLLARQLWPERRSIAVWAATTFVFMAQVFVFARRVRGLDLCFIAFALAALSVSLGARGRLSRWALAGFFCGFAFLTKSVVLAVMVPPMIVIWWTVGSWRRRLIVAAIAIGTAALPIATWFCGTWVSGAGAGLTSHFQTHVVARATDGPLVGETQLATYYIDTLFQIEGLMALVYLGAIAVLAVLAIRKRRSEGIVALWVISVFGLFTLATTKLPQYMLPAYPAFALAFARTLNLASDSLATRLERSGASSTDQAKRLRRNGFFGLMCGGLIVVGALASPIQYLSDWGHADWSPHHRAGAQLAREILPDDDRLLYVFNEYHIAAQFYFDGPTRLLTTDAGYDRVYRSTAGFVEGSTWVFVQPEEIATVIAGPQPTCLLVADDRQLPGMHDFLSSRFDGREIDGATLYCAQNSESEQ